MQGGIFDKLQDGIFCISVYWIGGEMRPMLNEETTAVLRRRLSGMRRGRGRVGVGVVVRLCRTPVVIDGTQRRSTRSAQEAHVGLQRRKERTFRNLGNAALISTLGNRTHTLKHEKERKTQRGARSSCHEQATWPPAPPTSRLLRSSRPSSTHTPHTAHRGHETSYSSAPPPAMRRAEFCCRREAMRPASDSPPPPPAWSGGTALLGAA